MTVSRLGQEAYKSEGVYTKTELQRRMMRVKEWVNEVGKYWYQQQEITPQTARDSVSE